MAHAGIVEQHELVHIGRLEILPNVVARVGQAPVAVGVRIHLLEAIVVGREVRGAAVAHESEHAMRVRLHRGDGRMQERLDVVGVQALL